MKKLLTILTAFTAMAVSATETSVQVTVTNPTTSPRKAVPVVVKLDGKNVKSATVRLGDRELPCQLDDLNDDGIYDELAFVTDVAKKEKQTISVVLSDQGEPRKYEPSTYGYVGIRDRSEKKPQHQQVTSVTWPSTTNPYNYIFPHGAIMENDMVGFRVYADHRQSIDYYGHRNLKCDVAETAFYTSQEQRDNGYGEDVLYTGSTYGCGALHGWDAAANTSIMFKDSRNHTQTVVCQGPVRTILDITNKGWKPTADAEPVNIRTRYLLYMGHRDVEVQVQFSRPVADIPLSTGIVDIVEGSEEYTDKAGLRGDWGRACAGNNPKVYDTITVGLGVYVPKEYYKGDSHFTDKDPNAPKPEPGAKPKLPNQAYVQLVGTQTDNLHYWFASTCHIETFNLDGTANRTTSPSKEEWFKWLTQWKKQLETPCKVTVGK